MPASSRKEITTLETGRGPDAAIASVTVGGSRSSDSTRVRSPRSALSAWDNPSASWRSGKKKLKARTSELSGSRLMCQSPADARSSQYSPTDSRISHQRFEFDSELAIVMVPASFRFLSNSGHSNFRSNSNRFAVRGCRRAGCRRAVAGGPVALGRWYVSGGGRTRPRQGVG